MDLNDISQYDDATQFVLLWIKGRRDSGLGDPELEALLIEAYCERKYHLQSNGCNLVNELSWPFGVHAACVVHDMLYGLKRGWSYSDRMMRKLNVYFGHPYRGWVRWAGLRLGGWYAYYWGS